MSGIVVRGCLAGAWLFAAAPALAQTPERPSGPIRFLVIAADETTLSSQMAGRVVKIASTIGTPVTRGGLVALLDCGEPKARLKIAEADALAARETLDAKLRLQGLDSAGPVEVALATAASNKAEAQVELQRVQADYCEIRSPFDGFVVKAHIRAHQTVAAGQAMLDLVSDAPLKLKLNVPSAQSGRLKTDARFELVVDETKRRYTGAVSAINSRIDPVSQTIEIEARVLPPAPGLLPGMSGYARLTTLPPQ